MDLPIFTIYGPEDLKYDLALHDAPCLLKLQS